MPDPDGLVAIASPETVTLPRAVEAPRVLTIQSFYLAADPTQWLARVQRGTEVLGEFGPLAKGSMPPVVGAAEALEILGVRGPNLNRIAGVADLPYQDLKMGRVWARADIETLAATRAGAKTTSAA